MLGSGSSELCDGAWSLRTGCRGASFHSSFQGLVQDTFLRSTKLQSDKQAHLSPSAGQCPN